MFWNLPNNILHLDRNSYSPPLHFRWRSPDKIEKLGFKFYEATTNKTSIYHI